MSTGSNPVTTIGTRYFAATAWYSPVPITVQTCPAARNPCTLQNGDVRIASSAGGTRTCATRMAKFWSFLREAISTAIAFAGAVVSKPTAKKTTRFVGSFSAMATASSGE